jgi:type 1 fimbriae regulatory protein FimB
MAGVESGFDLTRPDGKAADNSGNGMHTGEAAFLPFAAHPHMLRHACGFALADQGADTRLIQDYPGHRKIEHTVKYTATNPARFERLWRS